MVWLKNSPYNSILALIIDYFVIIYGSSRGAYKCRFFHSLPPGTQAAKGLVFSSPVAEQRAAQLAILSLKCDSPSLPTSDLGKAPSRKTASSDTSLRDETCLGC